MNVRCPHCHNPIELVDDAPLADITCPSCGSGFSLIHEASTATITSAGETRKIAHFELVRELGTGQFGSVWLAKDTELQRSVAIKIPRRESLSARESELFLRDARAAAQLQHPNIASVHEVGKENDTLYIVSDLIEGASLKEWLSARRLSAREAAELMVKVALAVQHAHERGVIHRDLKPGNIMMDSSGQPKVIDFGLAKREAGEITMTVEGQILGTPAYMPPEQAGGKGHEADSRSDVYSLGVILFELLTGELPFRGDAQMLLVQIKQDEPPRPRKLNAKIPRDLETITLKCLEKDPGKRYASAKALADDLERWLGGQPITARPVGRIGRGWRWVKRHPVPAGLGAALVVSLVVGTIASTRFAYRATENAARADANAIDADNERREALLQKDIAEIEKGRAKDQAEVAEHILYSSQLAQAQLLWDSNNAEAAWSALNRCSRKFRGWEYDYLCAQFADGQITLRGHNSSVTSVAFSPDGKCAASAGEDGLIKLWEVSTGQATHTLRGHSNMVASVAFSPDGCRLVSGGYDNTIRLWDVNTGQELRTLEGHKHPITSIAFSPNGKWFASGSSFMINVWNADAPHAAVRTLIGSGPRVHCVAFDPEQKRLASCGCDSTVRLWDLASGEQTHSMNKHKAWVTSVAFESDGKRLASASLDGTIKVWDAENGQESLTLYGHSGPVNSIAFSGHGRHLASGGDDRTIRLWNAQSGQQLVVLKGHSDRVLGISYSPDGKQLLSGSSDLTAKVWEVATFREGFVLHGHRNYISGIAFSPDGTRFASWSADGTIKVWESISGQEILTFEGHPGQICCAAFSFDGNRLASIDATGTMKAWDVLRGSEVEILYSQRGAIRRAVFGATDKLLASSCDDQTISVFDLESGKHTGLSRQEGEITALALSVQGTRIAAGNKDGEVNIWDASSGQDTLKLRGHSGKVSSIAFSPDGARIASVCTGNMIKVWNCASGDDLLTVTGLSGMITGIAFAPDGKRLFSSSSDNTINVWDANSGQELITLRGHADGVSCLVLSPDGKCLLSGGNDGTMRSWQTERPVQENEVLWARAAYRAAMQSCVKQSEVEMDIRARLHNRPEAMGIALRLLAEFPADHPMWNRRVVKRLETSLRQGEDPVGLAQDVLEISPVGALSSNLRSQLVNALADRNEWKLAALVQSHLTSDDDPYELPFVALFYLAAGDKEAYRTALQQLVPLLAIKSSDGVQLRVAAVCLWGQADVVIARKSLQVVQECLLSATSIEVRAECLALQALGEYRSGNFEAAYRRFLQCRLILKTAKSSIYPAVARFADCSMNVWFADICKRLERSDEAEAAIRSARETLTLLESSTIPALPGYPQFLLKACLAWLRQEIQDFKKAPPAKNT